MNDGCHGGQAHYHGFMYENGHLVTEECAPNKHKMFGDSCKNYAHCPKIATIKKTYWVGGDFNLTPTELQIQQELLMHGPVATSMMVEDQKFYAYKGGVFLQDPIIYDPEGKLSKNNAAEDEILVVPSEGNVEFVQLEMTTQEVNHAVFLVGWGATKKGVKYWIVRNTHGNGWGMHGDFYNRRGLNDWGIESELSAFEPELIETIPEE